MPTNDSNPNISDPFWISGRPLFRDSVVEARNNNYRIRDAGERSVERSKSLVALRRQPGQKPGQGGQQGGGQQKPDQQQQQSGQKPGQPGQQGGQQK